MNEIGVTGIYEYPVRFQAAWGIGDFTIVCSESTKGTIDALTITVVRHDLDDVAGQISAVLGNTSGLKDLSGVGALLNNQMGIIEAALGKVSMDIVEGVTGSGDLKTIHSELTQIGKQMKRFTQLESPTLEKLGSVDQDKKNDVVYLKNKTQEIKALIELNNKMMSTISDKPVTQSWFEFR